MTVYTEEGSGEGYLVGGWVARPRRGYPPAPLSRPAGWHPCLAWSAPETPPHPTPVAAAAATPWAGPLLPGDAPRLQSPLCRRAGHHRPLLLGDAPSAGIGGEGLSPEGERVGAGGRLRPPTHPADLLPAPPPAAPQTGVGAEGPAVFKHAGRHYLFASHLTGGHAHTGQLYSLAGGVGTGGPAAVNSACSLASLGCALAALLLAQAGTPTRLSFTSPPPLMAACAPRFGGCCRSPRTAPGQTPLLTRKSVGGGRVAGQAGGRHRQAARRGLLPAVRVRNTHTPSCRSRLPRRKQSTFIYTHRFADGTPLQLYMGDRWARSWRSWQGPG